ncbi:MAG: hypothetical protein A2Z97_02400 [Bdellovibrionales bacterium GWB1_52_6]|nr:MAG: hypothetical protein A2Z97_02400 [Bdellovibrionales bacterium GWB1_52_6]OFZ02816.1 MAG: hypothetical protein A2X97_04385 [Bdellovibrionales bacterium GWA1_52_35]HCM38398.1 hypothetical protein [Bdellovibrionales bacterium]
MLTIFVKFYIQSAMNASLFPDHLPSPPSRRSWHSRFLWLPQLGFGLGLVLSSQLAFGPQLWAAVAPSSHLSLGAEQFARENRADPKVELNLFWASEQNNRELRLYSFFESGQGGDRSFDLDRAVVRVPTTSTSAGGYFWLGRTHPLEEGAQGLPVETTSAIGAHWVQNQSDALNPRASGWIGAGWSGNFEKFSLDAAASPLFLPSFGPRLDLSETDAVSGSRYARLPPQFVNSKRALVAIRYKVETGSIKNIVLQHQAYVAFGKRTELGTFRLLGWSAPSPDPELDVSDIIRVNSEDANALVTAAPRFPRQNFVAFQWRFQGKFQGANSSTTPLAVFESAYETGKANLSTSLSVRLLKFLRLGVLQTSALGQQALASNPALDSASYAEDLVWTELSSSLFQQRLRAALRWEQHWTSDRQGTWVRPLLEYSPEKRLILFAQANLLAGQAASYFGAWRSLDSVNTGVSYLW